MHKVHGISLDIAPTEAFLPSADLDSLAPRVVAAAADPREVCFSDDMRANPAHLDAAARFGPYERGFHTEVLTTFDARPATLGEWWKHLYGESEGKDGEGIFPASTVDTTDQPRRGGRQARDVPPAGQAVSPGGGSPVPGARDVH